MIRLTLAASAVAASALFATVAQATPVTYMLEPTHTFVTFEAKHFGVSTNRGRFDKKSGTVTIDTAAKTGSVDIVIDTASINTGTAAFDSHLRGKDFFNTQAHPQATFKGNKVNFDGDKVSSVEGTLTLLGQSRPVTLKASGFGCYDNPFFKRQVCGGDFETTIQRADFGMTYGLPGIPNDVKLVIQVEAVRQ